MSYIATTVTKDVRRIDAHKKRKRRKSRTVQRKTERHLSDLQPEEFNKNAKEYITDNYADVLDYRGRDDLHSLDRTSVRELKLTSCIAVKVPLREDVRVDPPEIFIHGRRITTNAAEEPAAMAFSSSDEEEGLNLADHRRTASSNFTRTQVRYHSRSSSLPFVALERSKTARKERLTERRRSGSKKVTAKPKP